MLPIILCYSVSGKGMRNSRAILELIPSGIPPRISRHPQAGDFRPMTEETKGKVELSTLLLAEFTM
jgi:hypothetical protein